MYANGDQGVFMDQESYEQYEIGGDLYDDIKGYLLDGCDVSLGVFNEQVVTLEMPQVVELIVTETAPAIKNATATAPDQGSHSGNRHCGSGAGLPGSGRKNQGRHP